MKVAPPPTKTSLYGDAGGDADGAEDAPLQREPEGEDDPAHDERVAQVGKVAEVDGGRRRRRRVQLPPGHVGRQPEGLAPEGPAEQNP